jgi:SAM-dependent methyltransferase
MPTATVPAVNHWHDDRCARAFWGQQDAPPYRRLLADTTAWLDPRPGERWLDLGCGCGQLTQALWTKAEGRLRQIVGLDCAAANEAAFGKLRAAVRPPAGPEQIRFVCADFSDGLASWEKKSFDGAVSGLAIQYAESYSEEQGRWTTEAYEHLLREIYRVLRPGGRFVFSVNVPEPAWGKVALRSLHGVFQMRQPGRFLKRAWRMMRYGAWLKEEARRGRFHFLPWDAIEVRLTAAGFTACEHRLSYAGQAYVIRCRRPT